jgi:predicted DNA-binding transcriptional regulator YafY
LRLLSLLQSRRDWSGPELAARLEVTTRTVRNDVERLRRLGYAVDATPGVAGGYRLGTAAVFPPLLLDNDEAVAVAVGLRSAAGGSVAGIEEASVRALAKVDYLLPPALRQRVSALQAFTETVPIRGPAVAADLLSALAVACRDRQRVRFDYRRHDGVESRREVEPHRLVNDRRRWYLVAWDDGSNAWRTFRVDRITLPKSYQGARFAARELPEGDAGRHVELGVGTAMWQYRATVSAHCPADALLARLPPAVTVDPIDDTTCRVHVGSDTPQMLAVYLGMLDVDFDLENPGEHPDLLEAIDSLAGRFERASLSRRPARR